MNNDANTPTVQNDYGWTLLQPVTNNSLLCIQIATRIGINNSGYVRTLRHVLNAILLNSKWPNL